MGQETNPKESRQNEQGEIIRLYQQMFKKESWTKNERYFEGLTDNVQNLLCQLKEQENYVKICQEVTAEMEKQKIEDDECCDERTRKARERLRKKLGKNSS